MSTTLIILLCVDAVLLASCLIYLFVKYTFNANKQEEQPVFEEEPKRLSAPSLKIEAKTEEPISEPIITPPPTEDLTIGDIEVFAEKESIKRVPFNEKMLFAERKIQVYYDTIKNTFLSYRKLHSRVSTKGDSFRLGRELVAKIIIRGKTMKLFLALSVSDYDVNIYHQKDSSDVKSYAEIPFTVKVKSDRGLNNALKLVAELMTKKGAELKARYTPIDSLELLKN